MNKPSVCVFFFHIPVYYGGYLTLFSCHCVLRHLTSSVDLLRVHTKRWQQHRSKLFYEMFFHSRVSKFSVLQYSDISILECDTERINLLPNY